MKCLMSNSESLRSDCIKQCQHLTRNLSNLHRVQLVIPLPDMPILGSSDSAANKDMMSKIWTNIDTII